MAEALTITVYGTPAPQGSKRAYINARTGRAVIAEQTGERQKSWRQAVVDEALKTTSYMAAPVSAGGLGMDGPFSGPVGVGITFFLGRPKSHYRTGKNAHLLRDTAPRHPAKNPDVDKLVRNSLDGLTAAGIYEDDGQVVLLSAAKTWCRRGQPPGAVITVREVWEAEP